VVNGNQKKREELMTELVSELRFLRKLIHEVGEGFIIRKESEVEALVEHLATLSSTELRTVSPDWLRRIRHLKVKPAKGRLKDLKHIDLIIEELHSTAAELGSAALVRKKKSAKVAAPPSPGHTIDTASADPPL
jgi:hypothetical protein